MNRLSVKISVLVSLVSLILLLFSVSSADCGKLAANFTLTDIDGADFSLSAFRGKIVLLNFFSTWCSSCIAEMQHLKVVHDEFGEGLVMISISIDPSGDTVEKLLRFRQENNMDWIVARDTAHVSKSYVSSVPTIVIIDKRGYVRYIHVGRTQPSILASEILYILSRNPGIADVNQDGTIDIIDLAIVARAFRSLPGNNTWNEAADVDDNGVIGIIDVTMVSANLGKDDFNFLLNPSFEIDVDGDNLPEYWKKGGSNDTGAFLTWLYVGHTSSHSLRLTVTYKGSASDLDSAQVYQLLNLDYSPLEIGSSYGLCMWYRSTVKSYIFASFTNSSSRWIGDKKIECEPAADWKLSPLLEFTIPEGSYRMTVGVLVRNDDAAQQTNAYVIADDFELICR